MSDSTRDLTLRTHFQNLASASKRYTLQELLTLSQAVQAEILHLQDATTLDTVPASVNGSLWYELRDNSPVLIFRCDGKKYSLSPTFIPPTADPELSLSSTSVTVYRDFTPTVTLSYHGNGTVSFEKPADVIVSYDDVARTINFSPANSSLYYSAPAQVVVKLSADGDYSAAQATVTVEFSRNDQPISTETLLPDNPLDIEKQDLTLGFAAELEFDEERGAYLVSFDQLVEYFETGIPFYYDFDYQGEFSLVDLDGEDFELLTIEASDGDGLLTFVGDIYELQEYLPLTLKLCSEEDDNYLPAELTLIIEE